MVVLLLGGVATFITAVTKSVTAKSNISGHTLVRPSDLK